VRDGSHQGIAVLGIAAIAMGEDIGSEMVLRSYNHLVSLPSCLYEMVLRPHSNTL